MLEMGGSTVEETPRVLPNKYLNEGRITDAWHNAEVVLPDNSKIGIISETVHLGVREHIQNTVLGG